MVEDHLQWDFTADELVACLEAQGVPVTIITDENREVEYRKWHTNWDGEYTGICCALPCIEHGFSRMPGMPIDSA